MEMRAAAGPLSPVPDGDERRKLEPNVEIGPWLAAFGGGDNVVAAGAASSRLWIDLADPSRVDEAALRALGVRMIARPKANVLQLIIGGDVSGIATGLQAS
jgi:PTS system N-acetylglucosamine-specific IIC component